jgi:hypothetical protein
MRPAAAAYVMAGALLAPACTERLEILGPTPPGEGITIYIHVNAAGSSQAINIDVRDLDKVEGPCPRGDEGQAPTWSDCISSVRVADGWAATLYEDREFRGRNVTVTTDVLDFRFLSGPCDGSFNDCVSSMRVFRR